MWLLFVSSRRRHTSWPRDWSSDVCSSDLAYCLSSGNGRGSSAAARAGASSAARICSESSAGRAVADRAPSKARESSGGSVAREEASGPTPWGSPGSTSRPHPSRSAELTCVLISPASSSSSPRSPPELPFGRYPDAPPPGCVRWRTSCGSPAHMTARGEAGPGRGARCARTSGVGQHQLLVALLDDADGLVGGGGPDVLVEDLHLDVAAVAARGTIFVMPGKSMKPSPM